MKKIENFSLISGSLHLVSSRISLAISGVLFWWVAARLYSVEAIGLGSALISASSLLIFFSSLGIAPTFIRFLPKEGDKGKLLGTFFGFSLFLLILFSLIFLLGLDSFLPKLTILKTSFYPFLFLIFVISMQIFGILDSIFIAFKLTRLVLFKWIIQNFLKIGLLLFVIPLGGFGIFSSNCLSAIVAILILILYFIKRRPATKFKLKIDFSILKRLFPFSLVNFLNAVSLSLPGMVFPLIIISLFSEREVGLFYIPWMIFYVYCSFILSVMSVFLMEASHGKEIRKLINKVVPFVFILATLGFLFFNFLGKRILFLFKEDFSLYSFSILKILFSSIFFFSINQIFFTLKNIEKKIVEFSILSVVIILSMVIFAFIFIPQKGLEGIAFSWLFANLTGNVFVLGLFVKNRIRKAL